jgi:predicted acylesterase/phospholipase RssA
MDTLSRTKTKYPRVERGSFEQTVLLLQGGGALGSYQAGVYQALAEANLHPDWVAGISIGSINSAIIAGNPPEKRVERLRQFWEAVSTPPLGVPYLPLINIQNESIHRFVNQTRALGILLFGAPDFFTPRFPPPGMWGDSRLDALSYCDVAPLKATLKRLVDFDRINAGGTRLSVGAVNVRTGNFTYFDTTTHRIGPAHIIASGSLPPGFPATEVDGEYYWDGGIVSNTHCNGCLIADRAATRWRSRSISGAQRASCRETWLASTCARRRSGFPAAPGRRPTNTSKHKSSASPSGSYSNIFRMNCDGFLR